MKQSGRTKDGHRKTQARSLMNVSEKGGRQKTKMAMQEEEDEQEERR